MQLNNNISISTITSNDWVKYKAIRLETIKNESDAFPNIYEKLLAYHESDWRKILDDRETIFFLAQSNLQPIGIVRVTFNDEEVDPDTAYIGGLYVNKDFRGNGIGQALLEHITEECKMKKDIKKMKLWVRATQSNAIQLYEKLGFKKVGQCEDVSEDGKKVSLEIIMEKIL